MHLLLLLAVALVVPAAAAASLLLAGPGDGIDLPGAAVLGAPARAPPRLHEAGEEAAAAAAAGGGRLATVLRCRLGLGVARLVCVRREEMSLV